MPSWLILGWALTLGVVPEQQNMVILGNDRYISTLTTNMLATSAELDVSAELFNHVRLWGGMQNFQYLGRNYRECYPYEAIYSAGAAIYAGAFEVGIKHECAHPVNAGDIEGHYADMQTEIYLRISSSGNK